MSIKDPVRFEEECPGRMSCRAAFLCDGNTISNVNDLCEQIRKITHRGYSVAFNICSNSEMSKFLDPSSEARAQFTKKESALFSRYERRDVSFPPCAFKPAKFTPLVNEAAVRTLMARGRALELMYRRDGITIPAAHRWCERYGHLVPICTALCKMIKTMQTATGMQYTLDPKLILEKRVCANLITTLGRLRVPGVNDEVLTILHRAQSSLHMRIGQLEGHDRPNKTPPRPRIPRMHPLWRSSGKPYVWRNLCDLFDVFCWPHECQLPTDQVAPPGCSGLIVGSINPDGILRTGSGERLPDELDPADRN